MIYTVLILLVIAEFLIILSIDKKAKQLDKLVTKMHGELDSLGKEIIFYKGENECLRHDIEKCGAYNKELRAKLSRKNCKKKKQETPAVEK